MVSIRLISVFLCILLLGCTTQRVSRELIEVEKAKKIQSTYVKVHLVDGSLYVLTSWKTNESAKTIAGNGNYYDFNRKLIGSGYATIPFDKITVLETNDKSNNPGVATMVIMGLLTVPASIYCLVNPKACFGSCPTYYVQNNDTEGKLIAEGFSASICKAMEETDVDVIDLPFRENRRAQVIVKNEALETHMIRSVNLMAVEKKQGERVLQNTDGKFYKVHTLKAPVKAEHNFNSVINQLSSNDFVEWYSQADSVNLLTKEDIFLEFENPHGKSALIIDTRQSLLTTFLFYHSLSITGNATGFFMAEIENGNDVLKKRLQKFYSLLGGIEISIQESPNKWKVLDSFQEAGPIATDMHLVRVPAVEGQNIKVRLRMTKGLWRIDMVNLATLIGEVTPQRISPSIVYHNQKADAEALNKLHNADEYLVTYPGDVFTLEYPIHFQPDYEYFIESQGYYIEWMRDEWLKYENLKLARSMLQNPSRYLKRLTPAYKAVEPEMEEVFWNSRYTNSHEK